MIGKQPLRIHTWLWQQEKTRTTYSAEDVNQWAGRVSRNLTIPHELVCVTDTPEGIDSQIEILPLPHEFDQINVPGWDQRQGYPQSFRRLDMFRPDAAEIYGERFVSMDLDCLPLDNLDPLFNRSDDFIMMRGTRDRRPFCGSLLMMNAGARPQVYQEFTPARAKTASSVYVGSDQAWIGYALGFLESTWGPEDGVYHFEEPDMMRKPKGARVVFFNGKRKLDFFIKRFKWLEEHL